jgi:hypothetical protein
MIKLQRVASPSWLTPAEEAQLVARYLASKEPVWNIEDIKIGLLKSSFHKCAYCESMLGEESKYVEVEHFRCKRLYPNDVVKWVNLLPACKRCNIAKSDHDVSLESIVNPYDDDPRDHLSLNLYRLRSKSSIGQNTIDVLNLNDNRRSVFMRFEVGQAVVMLLGHCIERLQSFADDPSTRRRNALVSTTTNMLLECQETAAYAATSSTVLHSEPDYLKLKGELVAYGLWSAELEDLHSRSALLCLP